MVRIINEHVVLPTGDNIPTHLFPQAKSTRVGTTEWLALPHTVEVARILGNLGVATPSPIRYGYEFPGPYPPYPHQVETAEFLTLNPRAFVTSSMGSGKTSATAWAADYLMTTGLRKKALIVAPLSTLQRVWGDAIFFHFPHRTCAILHGARDKRLELLAGDYDFYVINPDGLGVILPELAKRSDIDLVIVDEVAEFRNQRSDRWSWMKSVITPQRWAWGLTGTPAPQSPTDAYAQVKLINPSNLGGMSFTRFRNMTMMQVSTFKWVAKEDAMEKVYDLMRPNIRFRKEDCITLPPTERHDIEVALSPEQKHHYDTLVKHSLTNIGPTEVRAVNAAVLMQKLVQASAGLVYGQEGERARLDAGPRFDALRRAIAESEGKVIVFVPFTGVLETVASEVASWGYTVDTVDGSVAPTRRNHIFLSFQNERDPHVLIAHPRTMAHGLSLVAANTIVWFAPYTSNAIYDQACERVIRPGQTRITRILHIYGSPAERRIYAALKERKKMQDVLLDMLAAGRG